MALLISVLFMTIPFIAGCEWPEHLLFLIPTIWYFIPTYIALYRKHPSKTGILVLKLNVVLGWAFFGWLGALIWALPTRCTLPTGCASVTSGKLKTAGRSPRPRPSLYGSPYFSRCRTWSDSLPRNVSRSPTTCRSAAGAAGRLQRVLDCLLRLSVAKDSPRR